jgi:hypothetical protein
LLSNLASLQNFDETTAECETGINIYESSFEFCKNSWNGLREKKIQHILLLLPRIGDIFVSTATSCFLESCLHHTIIPYSSLKIPKVS